MKQKHVVEDPTTAAYADAVEQVWSTWEPSLRRGERLLRSTAWRGSISFDETADQLRRVQYRAHTAGELSSGLQAPAIAAGAHARLVASLAAARDTLGVLAVRAELGEIEHDEASIGMQALEMTRDAFSTARDRLVAIEPWASDDDPLHLDWHDTSGHSSRSITFVLWGLVAVCVVLFTVLLFEVFLLAPVKG